MAGTTAVTRLKNVLLETSETEALLAGGHAMRQPKQAYQDTCQEAT